MVIADCGKAQLEELQSELANERSANESLQKQLEEQKTEAQSAGTDQLSKIQELESSLAKMQEHEESLKSQIEKGELSPDQLRPHLIGKIPDQVHDFLGEPNSTYTGNKWRYTDKVLNPYSRVQNSLKIQFKNGVATLVDYWGGY